MIEEPSTALTRLVTGWLARPRLSFRRQRLLIGAMAATVLLIAWFDYMSGSEISLALLYLIPTVVVSVLVSTRAGHWLAIESGVATLAAYQYLQTGSHLPLSIASGLLRYAVLGGVVFLLGALRHEVNVSTAANQTTRDFLSTAAHQIRTPIAGVMVSAEALAVEPDVERRSKLTRNLIDGAERVGRLVSELLQISRLEDDTGWEERPVDLVELGAREVEMVAGRVDSVAVDLQAQRSVVVWANPDVLREAIANLLDNAVRHARARVTLSIHHDGDSAVLEVADDGAGVSAEDAERVFDRFVVLDGRGGTGLGLAIVRGAARAHGGDVRWTGSAFQLTIPDRRRAQPGKSGGAIDAAHEVSGRAPGSATKASRIDLGHGW